jgi:hypothetical protein
MDRTTITALLALVAALGVGACGSTEAGNDGAGGNGGSSGGAGGQAGTSRDGSSDGAGTCSYADGVTLPDGGAFQGVCPATGCPAGTVCVAEIGGVGGGGGEYCAPIPNECHGSPSCACMATCACTNAIGGRRETCSDQNGTIACDNGVR